MQLSPKQLWYAQRLADPSESKSHEELAAEIGVDRATLWRWRKIKGFGELVFSMGLLEVKADLGQIFGTLTRAAKRGDFRAIRLVFELSGILQPQSARKLFNEEVYTDYLSNTEYIEKFVEEMEEKYTRSQRCYVADAIRKALNDIHLMVISPVQEGISIGEHVQMQFSS